MFGIRRRRTKLVEKCKLTDNIETAKDALEDVYIKSMETIPNDCISSGAEPPKINKIKYASFILLGITGCYLCFRLIPIYIVSFYLLLLHTIYLCLLYK